MEHSITASSLIPTLISFVLFKNAGDEDEDEDEPTMMTRKRLTGNT